MAFNIDILSATHQTIVGEEYPLIFGLGPKVIRGSSYTEAPMIVGNPGPFPTIRGTLMIGPLTNKDSPQPIDPGSACGSNFSPYSLCVVGDAVVHDNLVVTDRIFAGDDVAAQGDVLAGCGAHRLSNKKNFDIPHPVKEGWRLRHTCLEGPENAVYFRGKIREQNITNVIINLPEYWLNFVDYDTITVSLTPFGKYQDLYYDIIDNQLIINTQIKDINVTRFNFQFDYHVYAERIDGEKLIPEYKGTTPGDYPGNNDEYSVSGYHYDRKHK